MNPVFTNTSKPISQQTSINLPTTIENQTMENNTNHFHEVKFRDENGNQRTTKIPVVQELARQGLNPLPERFIRESPTIHQHGSTTIPIINIRKLRSSCGEEELVKLGKSVRELGLFFVTEHGLELNGVKNVVKGFFDLSFDEKKQSVGSYTSVDNMGYGRNFVRCEDQKLDWIDRLSMKVEPKGADLGLHVWPLSPPNFRQVTETYVSKARALLDELLKAVAESLGLERHVFLNQMDPNESEVKLRVNYYPPCPRPDLTIGLNPHSDSSVLTLVMEFGATGGLQVMKEDKWVTVSWPEDALLVNAGDLLEIMSDGRLRSPWHRAVTQMDVERFSVAVFYTPPLGAEIGPENGDGEFRRVVVGDYLKNFYDISPTQEKEAIMYAKK